MTSERFNPPRADEHGPEALRDLVRERRRGPSADAVTEISARIAARTTDAASTSSTFAYSKLGALGFVVIGGFLLTPTVTRVFATRPIAAAPVTAAESLPDPAPEPSVIASSVAPISVDELPTAAPAAAPATAAPAARRPSSPSAKAPSSLEAPPSITELEAARRAQEMLASNPGRALAMADQLARDFPNGEFVQEREAIAVEALARVGRKGEALQRARALLGRFPRTPYAARLELVIGQPIVAASTTTSTSPPR